MGTLVFSLLPPFSTIQDPSPGNGITHSGKKFPSQPNCILYSPISQVIPELSKSTAVANTLLMIGTWLLPQGCGGRRQVDSWAC